MQEALFLVCGQGLDRQKTVFLISCPLIHVERYNYLVTDAGGLTLSVLDTQNGTADVQSKKSMGRINTTEGPMGRRVPYCQHRLNRGINTMGGGGTHDQRGGEEQSIRAILNTNLMGRINTTGGPTQRRGAIDQGHTSTQTLRGGLIQQGGGGVDVEERSDQSGPYCQ